MSQNYSSISLIFYLNEIQFSYTLFLKFPAFVGKPR